MKLMQDRNNLISKKAWDYFGMRVKLFAIWALIAVMISNFFTWTPFILFKNIIPIVTILLIIEVFVAFAKKRKLEQAFRGNAQLRRLVYVHGPQNLRYEFQFIYSKIIYIYKYNMMIITWGTKFYIYNLRNYRLIHQRRAHTTDLRDIIHLEKPNLFATIAGYEEKAVKIWKFTRFVKKIVLNFEPRCLAYLPSKDLLLVGGYSKYIIAVSLDDFTCFEYVALDRFSVSSLGVRSMHFVESLQILLLNLISTSSTMIKINIADTDNMKQLPIESNHMEIKCRTFSSLGMEYLFAFNRTVRACINLNVFCKQGGRGKNIGKVIEEAIPKFGMVEIIDGCGNNKGEFAVLLQLSRSHHLFILKYEADGTLLRSYLEEKESYVNAKIKLLEDGAVLLFWRGVKSLFPNFSVVKLQSVS